MTPTSTLAFNVRHIFQSFAKQAQRPERLTVIAAWNGSFSGVATAGGPTVMECIGLVANSLSRLEMQINASKLLGGEEKGAAYAVVEGLRACIQPDFYLRHAMELQQHFSAEKIGHIGLIGHSLRAENPTPIPSRNDLSDIATQLTELLEALRSADLPSDLKIILRKHTSFMLWALENIDLVGAQELYESVANIMITANRIKHRDTNATDQAKSPAGEVVARVVGIAQKVLRVLRFADQSVQAYESLTHDLSPLLPGS